MDKIKMDEVMRNIVFREIDTDIKCGISEKSAIGAVEKIVDRIEIDRKYLSDIIYVLNHDGTAEVNGALIDEIIKACPIKLKEEENSESKDFNEVRIYTDK